VVGDAADHVAQIGFWVETIEPSGLDEGVLGTTPARLVASRSTTASGPPARASWIPASSSARRRSPWRYVLRSAGLVVVSVTILYVDTVHFACYISLWTAYTKRFTAT
jgi:hypothetical protein